MRRVDAVDSSKNIITSNGVKNYVGIKSDFTIATSSTQTITLERFKGYILIITSSGQQRAYIIMSKYSSAFAFALNTSDINISISGLVVTISNTTADTFYVSLEEI